jgi:hypothetical protein
MLNLVCRDKKLVLFIDRPTDRPKKAKPALRAGFVRFTRGPDGYAQSLYLTENQLFIFSVDFLVDSMSREGLFLPGFVQVDVGGIKVGVILFILTSTYQSFSLSYSASKKLLSLSNPQP